MAAAEFYRQYAAECLRAIELATTPEAKADLLHLAQLWNELADWTERHLGSAGGGSDARETVPATP